MDKITNKKRSLDLSVDFVSTTQKPEMSIQVENWQ